MSEWRMFCCFGQVTTYTIDAIHNEVLLIKYTVVCRIEEIYCNPLQFVKHFYLYFIRTW